MLQHALVLPSLLLLDNIPLCGYATFCLSSHQLMEEELQSYIILTRLLILYVYVSVSVDWMIPGGLQSSLCDQGSLISVSSVPTSTGQYQMLNQYLFILFYFLIHLFIYFWLRWVFVAVSGFLYLWHVGFSLRGFSCCGAQALGTWATVVVACRLSSCGLWALEHRLSSCGARAQLLHGMWDLHRPGLEPVSPALAGGFLTTVPPGKSQSVLTDESFYLPFQKSGHFLPFQCASDPSHDSCVECLLLPSSLV